MKKLFTIMLAMALIYVVVQAAYSGYYFKITGELTKTKYTQDVNLGGENEPILKVFMSGDSIAAGVGASSFETSTAGRLANFLARGNNLIFINEAKSGTKMADLLDLPAPKEKQDLIILIVSSNDLFSLTNLDDFERSTEKVLEKYSRLGKKLIIPEPGNVSAAPALPLPLRLIYKIQRPKYVAIMAQTTSKYPNIVYIKHGLPKKGTFASDKFHPNDKGHKVWFEGIKDAI